jgi:hypothetical protein
MFEMSVSRLRDEVLFVYSNQATQNPIKAIKKIDTLNIFRSNENKMFYFTFIFKMFERREKYHVMRSICLPETGTFLPSN